MLDADEVSVRLDAIRLPDWREQIERRAAKPGRRKYRPLVAAVLEPATPSSPAVFQQRNARLIETATTLDGLSPDQLGEVMAILHPSLGPSLARWWTDSVAQPYTRSWLRRSFRAPRHPEASRPARIGDLHRLISQIGPYDRDAVWLAAWASYLAPRAYTDPSVGPLLAAAIDAGGPAGDAVLHTLIEVGNGEHPVGVMGRHVVTALLRANPGPAAPARPEEATLRGRDRPPDRVGPRRPG